MNKREKHISTDILNERFHRQDSHGSINMPIYSGAAFEFETAEDMEAAFLGQSGKHTYTRISNPTVESFEKRVKVASGAEDVIALASGMAAISNLFITIASAGSNIVTSTHLFGNTFSLFLFTLNAFNVEVRFCDLLDLDEVEKKVDENTCAIFAEIISNPHLEVVDLKALSALAERKKVPLVADTTVIPWTALKSSSLGVHLEVVSSTKYISGGATSIGGLILDYGSFDWNHSRKLKPLAEKFGNKAFSVKLRTEVFRNMGACMSPQVAFLQSTGLETLDLRYRRASGTCLELAKFLQTIDLLKNVNYTGLQNNPFHEVSQSQFGECPGAMLTFSLEEKKACYAFMNKLKVIRRATNLFDNKSLIIHPSSTIYGNLSPEYRKLVEVPDNMMRLSVGLEDLEDLKSDIMQALH